MRGSVESYPASRTAEELVAHCRKERRDAGRWPDLYAVGGGGDGDPPSMKTLSVLSAGLLSIIHERSEAGASAQKAYEAEQDNCSEGADLVRAFALGSSLDEPSEAALRAFPDDEVIRVIGGGLLFGMNKSAILGARASRLREHSMAEEDAPGSERPIDIASFARENWISQACENLLNEAHPQVQKHVVQEGPILGQDPTMSASWRLESHLKKFESEGGEAVFNHQQAQQEQELLRTRALAQQQQQQQQQQLAQQQVTQQLPMQMQMQMQLPLLQMQPMQMQLQMQQLQLQQIQAALLQRQQGSTLPMHSPSSVIVTSALSSVT
jgi:hypothetical protein